MCALKIGSSRAILRSFWGISHDKQCAFYKSFSTACSLGSSENATPMVTKQPVQKKMSIAMKYYLDKKKEHDTFIAKERSEFELGKKHLANMMGMEAEAMTQDDIDKAIDYLFPSGLYNPESRPMMKPPEQIFPKQKEAEFNEDGRPHHPFYYCVKPNFIQIMYEVVDHLENVTFFGDRMMKQKRQPDPDQILDAAALSASKWIEKPDLAKTILESIRDSEYQDLIGALERLVEYPYSYRVKDFIFKYRVPISTMQSTQEFIPPQMSEDGRAFVEFIGQSKSAMAQVRVTKPGTGKFIINHIDYPEVTSDITYFYSVKERHQLLYPLQFSKQLGLVDVECIVGHGGPSAQAGAIRYATAMCLRSFVDSVTADEMKMLGLLTQNVRVPERKKPGQEKARRKYTWLKR